MIYLFLIIILLFFIFVIYNKTRKNFVLCLMYHSVDSEKGKGGMEKRLCCGCRPGIGRISSHPFLGRGDSRAGGSQKDRLPRVPCGQYEEKWQVLC